MAEKYDVITELYAETIEALSRPLAWPEFLKTAGRNFGLPFENQVLLFAQRPDATAVLPISGRDGWNRRFGRWVNRGAKGVALFDHFAPGQTKLKYAFDISDTHESKYAKPVPLWEVEVDDTELIYETLVERFGISREAHSLAEALEAAAIQLTDDHYEPYLEELRSSRTGSSLEGLSDAELQDIYRDLVQTSAAFMVQSRCMNEEVFWLSNGQDAFRNVALFNTPETLNALGLATREVAQICLSEIARTMQREMRNRTIAEKEPDAYVIGEDEIEIERSDDHEEAELHTERGLSAAPDSGTRESEPGDREVWQDAAELSDRKPARAVHEPADQRQTEQPPGRSGLDRSPEAGADGAADGPEHGRDRGTERAERSGVDGPHEQHQDLGGGSPPAGAGVQLKDQADSTELSAFFDAADRMPDAPASVEDQLSFLEMNFDRTEPEDAFTAAGLPQQIIDEALCIGANDPNSRKIICAYLMKDKPAEDNAKFLQNHYKTNGAGFYVNGRKYALWYDADGLRIAGGRTAQGGNATELSWLQAAKRIRELLDLGRYMPQTELDTLQEYERSDLANRMILLARDLTDTGMLPTMQLVLSGHSGFPEMIEQVNSLLLDPEFLDSLVAEWHQFVEAYENNPDLLRFNFYRPKEILMQLQDLQREPVIFHAEEAPNMELYISDDEINQVLRGGPREAEYRLGVYKCFTENPDAKTRENYLKHYHGEYSGYSGGNDHRTYSMGKGLSFSHGSISAPYAQVNLKWSEVASRIGSLIAADKFLTESDRVRLQDEPEELEDEDVEIIPPPMLKTEQAEQVNIDPAERHNFRITDTELGYGTPGQKYSANVAAIRLLKRIEGEGRLATPEEQQVLSNFVGWGGLSVCFEENHSKYEELKSLLTEEEYAAARASSLTAFYTAPTVISSIYKALGNMGFKEGNILEPSCGVGNFIGMLPDNMAGSQVIGVELDSISGRIAKQLYQNSTIHVSGYEQVELPDSFFDVAVGNVPFGDFRVQDKRYDKNNWLIHDYFFGKTLDKIRPGGVVAFITSKGTMDKENSSVRRYLAQRADLIGAIRLPNDAFKRNAGTEVTSDIIFLQKRDHMTDLEPDWVHLDTDANGIRMNRYFVQHPDMIMGTMVMESSRFGMDSVCKAYEGMDLSERLNQAIANLHAEIGEYEYEQEEQVAESIPADPSVRNFSYTIVDGQIYFRQDSRMSPVKVSQAAENRIRGLIELRECVRKLIAYQTEGYPDENIAAEQKRLNQLYDDYTAKNGLLNSRGNSMAFSDDSSYYLLCSLEVMDDEGNFKCKADMFTKRTIRPHEAVKSVDTASEALAVSISEYARVDMPYMMELSGKSADELEADLVGVIFRDIRCAETKGGILQSHMDLSRYPFVTADEYLSGNVRKKLRMAKALQEALPQEDKALLNRNIEALTAVQPVDLTAGEIGVRIGANWIPTEIYDQFMYETFSTHPYAQTRMHVLYSPHTGEWNITSKSLDCGNIKACTTYGTKRVSAYHILENTLNQKDVRVFDTKVDDSGKEQRILNKKESALAQDRQELIKAQFSEWIWKDIDRREMLCKVYNETFNAIRPREYDGSHIRFSGMNPEITLRKHQVDAIAHIMYGGNTLLAHEVGAGKTFEMVAAAMESKRLGLCTKSLVVVPNHIIEQWASDWLQLYPSANILVASKKDFERKNRKKFCARIATGDYDAVIIGHSQFEKIPMSKERQATILQRQIDGIMDSITDAKRHNAERYSIKQMERTRKSLETKLAKLNDQSRKDDVVTFEQLGVDRIFIDESHYFKNLFLATKMRNVGGIAQTEAQKSSDLFMKCQYLDEITDGRGIVFATGTPISNSMVELYTIQRYLQYGVLQDMGMLNFDDWAATYGETVTAIELSPEGSGYRSKTRFAKFYNLPELMSTFKMVADIQTADMLQLPVPKANFHTEVIAPSETQQDMVAMLAERAEEIRAGSVDPSKDNMLKITNDGRKLALDMRLVQPLAPDDDNGKVSVCARNVYRIWDETKADRSAQLIFCDLSTPKADGTFNVYDDLKMKLMVKGVPEEEIAYIHDANTEAKKKELFGKVRSGTVRVLIGSTQKMGAGTNVQDRLIALHDLDCPWRPSDLAQRLGRIVRQGNQNPEVEVFRYVTENTFDAYLYQLVENKQKFISQVMTSKAPARVANDVDETALSYSEIKALATGNPLIIEKCNLDVEVSKLNMLKASHLNQKFTLENLVLRKYPADIARLTERIEGFEHDVDVVRSHPKVQDGFNGMEVLGKHYDVRKKAGQAILQACKNLTPDEPISLGTYRGFPMTLVYDKINIEYQLNMKGALSHIIFLSSDPVGNVSRMDNLLDSMGKALNDTRHKREDAEQQLENAKAELEKPFAREKELIEKTARLKELDILLNMDERDTTLLDEGPEEEPQEKNKYKDYER